MTAELSNNKKNNDSPKPEKKKRIISLDVLRSLAILCVLITHSSDDTFALTKLSIVPNISVQLRIFALTLHIIGRTGVPIFLFLTGYLMLNRTYESKNDIIQFWKKHLIPLFITCTIWAVIYYIYGIAVNHQQFSVSRLLMEIFFFKQYEGIQFWYIPHILGIYLFLPFISIILNKVDNLILFYVWLFCGLIRFIPPTINPILYTAGSELQFNNLLDLSYIGGTYGLLVLTGYWIRKANVRFKQWVWLLIYIICYGFLLWEEDYCFMHGYAYDLWYDNFALILMCISLFEFILGIRKFHFQKSFTWISRNSFGIFLTHELFINYLTFSFPQIIYWKKFLLLFTGSSGASIILVFILSLNSITRKYLLYQKR